MDITDIFSWLPAGELRLEEIEALARELENGAARDGYSLTILPPRGTEANILAMTDELTGEGKHVRFLSRDGRVIAVIGFRP